MTAYYNEFDPRAAAWLRELIADGLIAAGDVDERSILDVTPNDIRGYTQCHFFAGIGGWSLALRLAGWDDSRPVWSGSCPCQPFSEAGARKGLADERHLWPAWHYLIEQCRPPVIYGEQVEAAIRYGWLDLVQDDMEGIGYAFEAVGLPAACVGAPHIRQRLWFVAHADGGDAGAKRKQPGWELRLQSQGGRLVAVAYDNRRGQRSRPRGELRYPAYHPESRGAVVGLGLAAQGGRGEGLDMDASNERRAAVVPIGASGWNLAESILCRDGKARPVEPGVLPLAHGIPDRVGLLRGAGNAIVPQVAAAFIQASMTRTPSKEPTP